MLAAEGVVVDDVHAERCRDRWQLFLFVGATLSRLSDTRSWVCPALIEDCVARRSLVCLRYVRTVSLGLSCDRKIVRPQNLWSVVRSKIRK